MSGGIVTSILISVALTVVTKVIGALLAQPPQQQQSYGGSLPEVQRDPGTTLTSPRSADTKNIVLGTHRVAGNIVYWGMANNNQYLELIIEWAGHEVDSYGDLYFNDEVVTFSGPGATGKYSGHVYKEDFLGTDDQAHCSTLTGIVGASVWGPEHRGRGIAYSFLQLVWNRDLFPSGLPNIWRVVNGMKLYDPRTDTTTFSYNAALAAAAWLNNPRYGRGVPYTEIDLDALEIAADICDEVVTTLSGTEARYTVNGVLTSDKPFVDNFERVLGASLGRAIFAGGKWVIKAAAWTTPADTAITLADFREGFTVQTQLPKSESFNAVKGTYTNPARLWQRDDFPAVISRVYEIEDGGDGEGSGREFKEVALELTTSPAAAQRIARIDLRRARQPLAFTARLKLVALQYQPGDVIPFTIDYLGWTDKYFEIIRMNIAMGSDPEGSGQLGVIGVDVDFRETVESIYDWSATSDETGVDDAPNTSLPNPFLIGLPSNLRFSESLYVTRNGGGVKAQGLLEWDASVDAFVTSGGWYIAEYKLSSNSAWSQLRRVDDGETSIIILDMDPGFYDYRVWSYNHFGMRSTTALTIVSQQLIGLSAVPVGPTNLTLIPNGNFATLRWDSPADLDVEIGGHIVFRHASELSGAVWANGTTISKPLPAAQTFAVLPLVSGAYMAKYIDASGIWSDDFAVFYTRQDGALTFSTIVSGSLVEDPSFTGIKTDCEVYASKLKLGGSALFSAIPVLSAIPSLGYYGGVSATGTYDWSSKIDLVTKQRGRLTITKTTLMLDVFDLISERTGDVSTWAMFGGDVSGNEADAKTEARFTDNDPNGMSPTWTDWARVDAGEFYARGIQLRTILISYDPSFDIEISALSAIAEEVI